MFRPWVNLLTSAWTSDTGRCLAAATRSTWMAAFAGEMSGSSPDPDEVTASGGICEIVHVVERRDLLLELLDVLEQGRVVRRRGWPRPSSRGRSRSR